MAVGGRSDVMPAFSWNRPAVRLRAVREGSQLRQMLPVVAHALPRQDR
jgi:hypothetical protein